MNLSKQKAQRLLRKGWRQAIGQLYVPGKYCFR